MLWGCTTPGGTATDRLPDPDTGVLTLPDGSTRYIQPAEFAYSGKGSYTNPDGRTLTGTFNNGLLQGFGHEQHKTESYAGQWLDGKRHGRGELSRGSFKYVGDFADHLPHGQGKQTWSAGEYQGGFEAGLFAGQGVFRSTSGTIYQGQWQEGQRNGFGQERRADGSLYSGDWMADQAHGFGTLEYDDGGYYEGSWQQGGRHGYGTYTNSAEVVYEGLWESDRRHGYGKQVRPDGSYYEGEWQDGKQHGSGVAQRLDGNRHEGTWQQGFVLGPGIRTDRSGVLLSGNWNRNTISNGMIQLPSGAEYGGALFSERGKKISPRLLSWIETTSNNRDPHAQYLMASALLDYEDPAPDQSAAQVWLNKAAAAGHTEAQFRLALLLEEQDISTALVWLQHAAAAGHPDANQQVASYYHRGHYLQQDLGRAVQHYEAAIAKGSIDAANNLAWLLATTRNEELADPQRAVRLIQPFVLLLGHGNHLDTLAAAHARLGNMELARRMQRQALNKAAADDSADDTSLAEMQARLTLYEEEQPYIE